MIGRYPSKAVANWFIDRFAADGGRMTQLQLYKLVYIAHGWHLAADESADGLIAETVHAWKWGPVIPSLREEFRRFGNQPIDCKATDWLSFQQEITPDLQEHGPQPWEKDLLEWIYRKYGQMTGPQLIALTHQPGSPWSEVTRDGTHLPLNLRIPNDLIRRHYLQLLNRLMVKVS